MLSSPIATLALAAIVIAGSIAGMVGIIRRSSLVPLLAVVTGAAALLFFFSNLSTFALLGMILSMLVIALGATCFVVRQRFACDRRPARDRVYLSDSGHWRLRAS